MKNISVANMIEVLTMGVQAGFVDRPKDINAVARIAFKSSRKFLSECQETDNPPTDEMREVLSAVEEFTAEIVNNPHIEFYDESDESCELSLFVVELTRVITGLKGLVKSKW